MKSFLKWLFRKSKQQYNISNNTCNIYMIYYESYSGGSEFGGIFKDEFTTKKEALKYLKKHCGEIIKFEHIWNNEFGDWYFPSRREYGIRRYYCIMKTP